MDGNIISSAHKEGKMIVRTNNGMVEKVQITNGDLDQGREAYEKSFEKRATPAQWNQYISLVDQGVYYRDAGVQALRSPKE